MDLAHNGSVERDDELVDLILAVPGMTDPQFRQEVFNLLPPRITQQLRRHPSPRVEIVAMIEVFADNARMRPWDELVKALRVLLTGSRSVARVEAALIAMGLITPV